MITEMKQLIVPRSREDLARAKEGDLVQIFVETGNFFFSGETTRCNAVYQGQNAFYEKHILYAQLLNGTKTDSKVLQISKGVDHETYKRDHNTSNPENEGLLVFPAECTIVHPHQEKYSVVVAKLKEAGAWEEIING